MWINPVFIQFNLVRLLKVIIDGLVLIGAVLFADYLAGWIAGTIFLLLYIGVTTFENLLEHSLTQPIFMVKEGSELVEELDEQDEE